MTNEIFDTISSEGAKLVVLFLRQNGTSTVSEIVAELDLLLMDVYNYLSVLKENNIITELGQETYSLV